ncbi:uncharacterized protein [Dendropsophus ebraccatus]|uniref:uncharacterized protein isoform X2 n=1 Tax=Dendropsophus ebraccatus TaxID=150705 RepID=UPI003831FBCC
MILRFSVLMVMLCHGCLCHLQDSTTSPKLVASPDYHVYVTGEAVSLICQDPKERRNESFVFYKDSSIISLNHLEYVVSKLDRSHEGIYVCIISGRRSHEKAVLVYDPLPPPLISSQPPSVPGRPVTVMCSPSSISEWKHITFYGNGTEIFMATSFPKMSINEISISIPSIPGVYSCVYQVQKYGRLIKSQPSENVHVSLLDLTTESGSTVSRTPTYQTDQEIITETPSYILTEYSSLSSVSQMTTETEHLLEDTILTKIYYSTGSLLCALVIVLLIFLLCRFCLPMKQKKNRTQKTSFWMNHSSRRKSRKTSSLFQLPMTLNQTEEKNIYEQPDPCTTFMNPLSSPKPSNNQESFVHCVDPGPVVYDNVQEIAPITPVYVTLENQNQHYCQASMP